MIVDIHAHLMGPEFPGKAFWDGFTRLAAVQTGRSEERIRQRDQFELAANLPYSRNQAIRLLAVRLVLLPELLDHHPLLAPHPKRDNKDHGED